MHPCIHAYMRTCILYMHLSPRVPLFLELYMLSACTGSNNFRSKWGLKNKYIYIYCSLIRQFLASMLNFGGANPSGNSVCDDLELPTGFKLKQHHQCSKFLGPNASKSCLRGSEALWDCLVITTQACCSSIFEDISLICMALFLYQPFTIFFFRLVWQNQQFRFDEIPWFPWVLCPEQPRLGLSPTSPYFKGSKLEQNPPPIGFEQFFADLEKEALGRRLRHAPGFWIFSKAFY